MMRTTVRGTLRAGAGVLAIPPVLRRLCCGLSPSRARAQRTRCVVFCLCLCVTVCIRQCPILCGCVCARLHTCMHTWRHTHRLTDKHTSLGTCGTHPLMRTHARKYTHPGKVAGRESDMDGAERHWRAAQGVFASLGLFHWHTRAHTYIMGTRAHTRE